PPLRIRYGDLIISILSLNDPGSPSVALTTTIVDWPVLRAVSMTALSLRANGKPAPPWPRRSTWGAIATRSSAESRGSGPKISVCAARSSRASRSRPGVSLAAPIRGIGPVPGPAGVRGWERAARPGADLSAGLGPDPGQGAGRWPVPASGSGPGAARGDGPEAGPDVGQACGPVAGRGIGPAGGPEGRLGCRPPAAGLGPGAGRGLGAVPR